MKISPLTLIFAALTFVSIAHGDFQIVWSTIDGGGGQSSGGQYSLTGTIGQADATSSEGGGYEVLGGFWPGGPLCFVDLKQFAAFAQHWLEADCDNGNGWCGGADLNKFNGVDHVDLELFVRQWLLSCPYRWPLK